MIYLDNSATTRAHDGVIDVVQDVMRNVIGNPSSLHGLGGQAERLVTQAREVIARFVGCDTQEVLFTSGGTEANNLAIKGIAKAYQNRGNHIITSSIEHPSVFEVCKQLENEGWKVSYLPVDQTGRVRAQDVEKEITKDTVLVSIMHVNNEVGSIQPIHEIGQLLKRYHKIFFHVDAVQSFSKIPLSVTECGVDLMSVSGHKFHGPNGIGFLYKRRGVMLDPLLTGGGQEFGFRSGTHDVASIAGLARAIVQAEKERKAFLMRSRTWKEMLIDRFRQDLSHFTLNGSLSACSAPYILSISFPGLKAEVLVHALAKRDCYVSSKSACSSKLEMPSRILKAMKKTDQEALGSIRISMGFDTTEQDISMFAETLIDVVPQLQHVMKVYTK
ncbi:cysteine desulfurase [Hazenella sp. IB182357]|uniref:Cysteine desulfurase n=1 Tax=Polycladospora coralii TaxID=2771432 RepID=A0A926N9U8_9BACL|nr:cysteine desulfurase family protein [Polycladospora coralii]MBD1371210.1 cysteine desulfurase [Polycladospora coralii]MBS7530152.1 cysteine desulfurase [Polycladospora coralii]